MSGRRSARNVEAYWDIDRFEGQVKAILGPTNTGKTHFAIERMLGHADGMIGFPLRLLARENYDRIVAQKGARAVALITGEEKIIPPNPKWFVCTVESMPVNRQVEFLAVDEIQLCADADRGHIFTDRLLNARGKAETLFLGSDTMGPILRALVPDIRIDERLRMSTLSYAGAANLTRLPRRSAIVGFSVDKVYELAERVRRQKGGAAVVLGALSPRTRNAQVAMYQAGEVDYMVATDAIGMGLNMDVNHVAFSGIRKFDGRGTRNLAPVEIGQIAGRAGRYMNDGTFGTTAGHGPLPGELIEAIEAHRFDPVRSIQWRSRDLDFRSPKSLLRSLGHSPRRPELVRAREAEDQRSLSALTRDGDVMDRAATPDMVRLLWDVCQIPDFRKIMPDHHTSFLRQVYLHLAGEGGQLDETWVKTQIDRLTSTAGDIDALTGRLADIRTWTYISHRGDWLADPAHWQARTGAIEDALSDALHERLTQRFVDKRAAYIDQKRGTGAQLLSSVTARGDVVVEGQTVGSMQGVEFFPEGEFGPERRAVLSAARRAAAQEIGRRVQRLSADTDEAFHLSDDGRITWSGGVIARLSRGKSLLAPDLQMSRSDLLDNAMRSLIRERLSVWLDGEIRKAFGALFKVRAADLGGNARGLVYRLSESLGGLPYPLSPSEWQSLTKTEREKLSRLGVRMSPAAVYFKALQSPPAMQMRRILWQAHNNRRLPEIDLDRPSALAGNLSKIDWACLGFRKIGNRAVRFESLERLFRLARQRSQQGTFQATMEMKGAVGVKDAELEQVMAALGFAAVKDSDTLEFRQKLRRPKPKKRSRKRKKRVVNPDSPFAELHKLAGAK
ncbi:MAG: helicase-related protein [Pseudomonadota bacterium]|nr:helicase-related protein [Pseudomonadota bacterium]